MTHSGMFGAHTATRSPGSKRVQQRARRALRLAYEARRRSIAAAAGIRNAGDQRDAIGRRLSRPAQEVAKGRSRRTAGVVGPATWDVVNAMSVLRAYTRGRRLLSSAFLRSRPCLGKMPSVSGQCKPHREPYLASKIVSCNPETRHGTQSTKIFKKGRGRRRARDAKAQGGTLRRVGRKRRSPAASRRSRSASPRQGPRAGRYRRRPPRSAKPRSSGVIRRFRHSLISRVRGMNGRRRY